MRDWARPQECRDREDTGDLEGEEAGERGKEPQCEVISMNKRQFSGQDFCGGFLVVLLCFIFLETSEYDEFK